MIRWYDYAAAFILADFIAVSFFAVPVIGAFVAWGLYELWCQVYCQYRLEMEINNER